MLITTCVNNYSMFNNHSYFRSSNEHWASISELHHKLKRLSKHNLEDGAEEEMLEKTGVMFAVSILFLQTVWEYCRVVNRLDLVCKNCLGYIHLSFLSFKAKKNLNFDFYEVSKH